MPKGTFYVTTPIYYVNDVPHVGHAYCTIGADALARFKRMEGWDVFFLTGTDEHGQKIARTAREKGLEPKELADRVVMRFQDLWKRLRISHDHFVRTTDESHKRVAVEFFRRVQEKGFIRKGTYAGWYSHYEERFLQESEVADGKGPDGRPVEWVEEENYFFEMSKFQEVLRRHVEENPAFVRPESRRNELIQNFILPGLEDVCITRSGVSWGIPAPVPEKTVIYVWFDALLNYLSALGWPDGERFRRYWRGEGGGERRVVHLIGKDILRFHATLWPAMLMAAGEPLPDMVFSTGFITQGGQKMSKSLGNVVNPMDILQAYGPDALRYHLLREVPFGQDGLFTPEAFEHRFNSDLANDLGNLVHRSISMLEKYFGGVVPPPGPETDLERRLQAVKPDARALGQMLDGSPDGSSAPFQFHDVLREIFELVKCANKYVDEAAPWKLAKAGDTARLETVMYSLMESLRITAILLAPFLPETGEKIWHKLGYDDDVHQHRFDETDRWGSDPALAGKRTRKEQPLFPRIEKKEGEPKGA